MADIARYLDTDVAPGGVGSQVDPFASLNEAEAACQSLGVSGDTVTIHVTGSVDDTTAVTVDGWVTGVTCRVMATDFNGLVGGTDYTLKVLGFSAVVALIPMEIANIEIHAESIAVRENGGRLVVDSCILRSTTENEQGILQARTSAGILATNCVIISDIVDGNLGATIKADGELTLLNCTLHQTGRMTSSYGSAVIVTNCCVVNCGAPGGSRTVTNCAFDYSGEGTNPIQNLTWADEFTDYTNGDFSLKSGSNLIGVGATGTGVTEDITGTTRPSPPSVGVFEYISGGGGTTLTIADVGQPQGVDVTALDHLSPITSADVAQGQILDAVPVAQTSHLAAADVDQGQSINSSVLIQLHSLSTASINQPQTIQQVALAIAGGLTIANIDQGQGISSATLAQDSQVIAATIGQAQSLDSTNIDQIHALVASAVAQAQNLDEISLIVPGGLTIASINQSQTVDTITASQLARLVLDNINQGQGIEAVVVAVPGSPITIANVGQPQTVSQAVAGQITGLLVAGVDQGQNINNINFSIASGRLIIEFASRTPEVSFEARRPEIKFN